MSQPCPPNMTDDQDLLIPHYLTAEQCATRFAISLRHFKYLVASGEMPPPVKFGKSARWSVRTLEEFETEKMLQSSKPSSRRKCGRKVRQK